MVTDRLQCTGNLVLAQINVHHHGEAQCDGAGTGRYHHSVNGTEGVDKCRNTFLGISQQASQIAGFHITENQSCTDGNGNNMDHRSHIMAQRNDAEFQTHFHAAFGTLLDNIAYHEGHNALGLVILYHADHISGIISLAQNNSNAGNITGNQRNAQRTDNRIGNKTDAGLILVRISTLYVLQTFQNFRTYSSRQAGIQSLAQVFLVRDQTFQYAHTGNQVTQSLDLYTGCSINRGKMVGSIGESNFLLCAVLGDGIVDRTFGKAGNSIGAAINQVS